MTWSVIEGHVLDVLPALRPGSVDCVCTSPPYWMLRSYLPKNHPLKPLELGSEPTPTAFVANMVRVFGLVREALADHGTCWVNIGDTYTHSRGKRKPGDKHGPKQCTNAGSVSMPSATIDGIEEGNMALIPQRLAIALQDDGWIVRSVIVWHKPAPMPASVSGWAWRRCRIRDPQFKANGYSGKGPDEHEQSPAARMKTNTATMRRHGGGHNNGGGGVSSVGWLDCPGCKKCKPNDGYILRYGSWRPTSSWESVLMLAKNGRYFCDGEAVKTPATEATVSRDQYTRVLDDPDEQFAVRHDHETICNGANLRDVWKIASEPLREKHYAAFPTELVQRCLAAGTSNRGYCRTCGKPLVRVVEDKNSFRGDYTNGDRGNGKHQTGGLRGDDFRNNWMPLVTLGWRPSCDCQAGEPRPGLVLDPFCGSGRTGIQARRMGLNFVGIELNPSYAQMSRKRIQDDAPLFNTQPVVSGETPLLFTEQP